MFTLVFLNMSSKVLIYFLFISFLFIGLLNYPIIEIASKQQSVFGLPLLLVYLFIVWFLIIVSLFFISKKLFKTKKESE